MGVSRYCLNLHFWVNLSFKINRKSKSTIILQDWIGEEEMHQSVPEKKKEIKVCHFMFQVWEVDCVTRTKGVTVISVAADSTNMFPPLSRILKAACFRPSSCSVYRGLMDTSIAPALGVRGTRMNVFKYRFQLWMFKMLRLHCSESFTDYSDRSGPVQHWTWARTNEHQPRGFGQFGSRLLAGCCGKMILLCLYDHERISLWYSSFNGRYVTLQLCIHHRLHIENTREQKQLLVIFIETNKVSSSLWLIRAVCFHLQFIVTGIFSIVAGQFPSSCLVSRVNL